MAVGSSTYAFATAYPEQRKPAQFQNGVRFRAYSDAGGHLICEYSTDSGQNWQTPSAGAVISSDSIASVFIDPDNYIHVAGVNSGSVRYYRGTPTDASCTAYAWTTALTIASSGYDGYPDVVAHKEGTGWKSHVVWSNAPAGGNYAKYQRINITSAQVISLDGAAVTLGGSYTANQTTYPSIDMSDDHTKFPVFWTTAVNGTTYGVHFKLGTWNGSAMSWSAEEQVSSDKGSQIGAGMIDTQGRAVACFRDTSNNLRVFRRAAGGGWTDISPAAFPAQWPALALDGGDVIYIAYQNNGLYWISYNGAWSAPVLVDSDVTATYPSARRRADWQGIDLLYMKGAASPYSIVSYRAFAVQRSRRGFNAPILGRGRRGVFTP